MLVVLVVIEVLVIEMSVILVVGKVVKRVGVEVGPALA